MMSFAQWGNELYTGKKSYDVVGKRKIWYTIAIVMVVLSGLLLLVRGGLNLGIEFRGGSEFVVSNVQDMDQQKAIDALSSVDQDEPPRTAAVGSTTMRIQTIALSSEDVVEARKALAAAYDVPENDVTYSNIGPSWGQDVSTKALQGLVIFLVLVGIVMALYFRAWKMSAAALVALLHDLVVTVGIYTAVGFEVTPASVIGFLTILGYSLYDTVVVFDKVRENTADIDNQTRWTYPEAANLAINQTLVRSINTTVVALLPVGSILFIGAFVLGAGTLRDIALALFIGMAVGAYSSVFLAAPLEVTFRMSEPRLKEQQARVEARREKLKEQAEAEGVDIEDIVGPTLYTHVGAHLGQKAQPKRKPRR